MRRAGSATTTREQFQVKNSRLADALAYIRAGHRITIERPLRGNSSLIHLLRETVHSGDLCQNTFACAGAYTQRFEVDILAAHSGDEFAEILFDSVRSLWVAGGIENLVKGGKHRFCVS
jgi:hypothetical protein